MVIIHRSLKTILIILFNLKKRICLLAEGRMAYFGYQKEALEYFNNSLNITCPEYTNPGDFLIDILGIDVNNEIESRFNINNKCELFTKSELNYKLLNEINENNNRKYSLNNNLNNNQLVKASWYLQLGYLAKRSYLNYFRNYRVFICELLMTIVTALIGGTLYYQSLTINDNGLCTFNQNTSSNVTIALFYIVCLSIIINTLSSILVFYSFNKPL